MKVVLFMVVKKNKKERWYMIKLLLWANRIVMFSGLIFVSGIIVFGFVSESLAREILPCFWLFCSFSIIYLIYDIYSFYKFILRSDHKNNKSETSIKKRKNETNERVNDD